MAMLRLKDKIQNGFTLLEIMVALSIIAISLVVILHSHSLSIERANKAKNILISSILAQRKMAETELVEFSALDNAQGHFEEYPQFSWQRMVYRTPMEDLKKIVLLVSWEDADSATSTELINFIAKTK